jgi:signal transduction histidine kinase
MASYDPGRDEPSQLCQARCPQNALLLLDQEGLHAVIDRSYYAAAIVLGIIFCGLIARRWSTASAPRRRVLAPVWVSFFVLVVVMVNGLQVVVAGSQGGWFGRVLTWLSDIGQLAVPLAFLLGLLRSQLAWGAVGSLVIEVGEAPPAARLRDAMGRTLGDPSLELAFWAADARGYITPEGQQVQLPPAQSGRVVALVEQGGRPHAVIIHDPAVGDEHGLLEVVGAVARLGLENERLQAELLARLEEVRASRVRIVEAADAERRRIERNLHDGAQQRLISVAITLGQAQAQLERYRAQVPQQTVRRAVVELRAALADIRELAHGIQPAVLDLGLRAAVTSLAERAPLPVVVDVPACRYSQLIESTAYYIISEGIANAIKHAAASGVEVTVLECGERLIVRVDDDGIGGADPSAGTGLQGLADRAAALGGRMEMTSASGAGTHLEATLPCLRR